MSNIWKYFDLTSTRIAICKAKECQFRKEYPPHTSPTVLTGHLKQAHSDLYLQLKNDDKEKASSKQQKDKTLLGKGQTTLNQFSAGQKRPFSASSQPSCSSEAEKEIPMNEGQCSMELYTKSA